VCEMIRARLLSFALVNRLQMLRNKCFNVRSKAATAAAQRTCRPSKRTLQIHQLNFSDLSDINTFPSYLHLYSVLLFRSYDPAHFSDLTCLCSGQSKCDSVTTPSLLLQQGLVHEYVRSLQQIVKPPPRPAQAAPTEPPALRVPVPRASGVRGTASGEAGKVPKIVSTSGQVKASQKFSFLQAEGRAKRSAQWRRRKR
jgi:hypothetical protein